MDFSKLIQSKTNGQNLFAIVSLSALATLDDERIKALNTINIYSISDLLLFKPIHQARILCQVSIGTIAHDIYPSRFLDDGKKDTPHQLIPSLKIKDLESASDKIHDVFEKTFQISTIKDLADFPPFKESESFLKNPNETFFESPSAPDELQPEIIGSIASTSSYSTFIKQESIKMSKLAFLYDKGRKVDEYVDIRLLNMFVTLPYFADDFLFNSPLNKHTPEFNLGYIAKSHQEWINMGTNLGEPKKTISLAPGQPKNIAVLDWERRQQAGRTEDTSVEENLSNWLVHTRALDEVTSAVAKEHQSGKTDTASFNIGGSNSSSLGLGANQGGGLSAGADLSTLVNFPLQATASTGNAIAGSLGLGAVITGAGQVGTISSDTRGRRSIVAQTHQNITDVTDQKASDVRSLRSSIIFEDQQSENIQAQTTTIVNYNHSHTLNVVFYELLQHYLSTIKLADTVPILFLPFRPLDFDFEVIKKFWGHIKYGVIDTVLKDAFEKSYVTLAENPYLEFSDNKIRKVVVKITSEDGSQLNTIINNFLFITIFRAELIGVANSKRINTSGSVEFNFNNLSDAPKLSELRGVKITATQRPQFPISISVRISVQDSNGSTHNLPSRNKNGAEFSGNSVVFDFVAEIPSSEEKNTAKAVVNYVNSRKFFFTRMLLLRLEAEQLQVLIEAIMIKHENSFVAFGETPQTFGFNFDNKSELNIFLKSEHEFRDYLNEKYNDGANSKGINGILNRAISSVVLEYNSKNSNAKSNDIDKSILVNGIDNTDIAALHPTLTAPDIEDIKNAFKGIIEKNLKNGLENANPIYLSELVDPSPIAITGNTLILKVREKFSEKTIDNPIFKAFFKELFDNLEKDLDVLKRDSGAIISRSVYLPTSGLFAEGILGRANSSEKIDNTRFINWTDMPIPHLGPQINSISLNSLFQQVQGLSPNVPDQELQPAPPTPLPDPQGLAAIINAIQNGNMFRDMSKSDQLVSTLASLASLSGKLSELSSKLAGDAQQTTLQAASDLALKVAELAGNNFSSLLQRPTGTLAPSPAPSTPAPAPSTPAPAPSTPAPVPPQPTIQTDIRKVDLLLRVFVEPEIYEIPPSILNNGGIALLALRFNGDNRSFSRDRSKTSRIDVPITMQIDANTMKVIDLDPRVFFGSAEGYLLTNTEDEPNKPKWFKKKKNGVSPITGMVGQLRPDGKNVRIEQRNEGNSIALFINIAAKPHFPFFQFNTDFLEGATVDVPIPKAPVTVPIKKVLDAFVELLEFEGGSFDIDASFKITFSKRVDGEIQYQVSGTHDGFPAYELYVNDDAAYLFLPQEDDAPSKLAPQEDIFVAQTISPENQTRILRRL